ncbi:unnamed protein product [Schistocephalus solidus]|uniref:Reverse transcriptase domain-containing protein n=1 Tax=Schistocephalus solidus TaxID=70667 RepID=A0A183T7P5_SCHSO|nr:unnamed protein product [Schistocephalus solidus]
MRVSRATVHALIFADYGTINTVMEEDIQWSMDFFATGCDDFGIIISTGKLVVMQQPTPSGQNIAPRIKVNGAQLKNVENFAYLGNPLTRNTIIDDELAQRDSEASQVIGRLLASMWSHHGIHMNIKLKIYKAAV